MKKKNPKKLEALSWYCLCVIWSYVLGLTLTVLIKTAADFFFFFFFFFFGIFLRQYGLTFHVNRLPSSFTFSEKHFKKYGCRLLQFFAEQCAVQECMWTLYFIYVKILMTWMGWNWNYYSYVLLDPQPSKHTSQHHFDVTATPWCRCGDVKTMLRRRWMFTGTRLHQHIIFMLDY